MIDECIDNNSRRWLKRLYDEIIGINYADKVCMLEIQLSIISNQSDTFEKRLNLIDKIMGINTHTIIKLHERIIEIDSKYKLLFLCNP